MVTKKFYNFGFSDQNFKNFCFMLQAPTVGATALNITTLSITTLSIITHSIKVFYVTLSINNTDHNRHSITMVFIMLSVMPNVIMLSVVAPQSCSKLASLYSLV
jgi:hypothetical protein